MKPQMEAIEVKLQGMIANSPEDPGYKGSGGGGGDAPAMSDFEEELDLNSIKLW